MQTLNKTLLPKKSKYIHKEVLDLSGSTIRFRQVPIKKPVLVLAGSLAVFSFIIPDFGLGLLLGLFILRRWG